MAVRVKSTSDISLATLRDLANSLKTELALEVEDRQRAYKGGFEPPSWIALFNEAPAWIQALTFFAGIYVTGIISEAGKETWRKRGKVIAATISGANAIRSLAHGLHALRSKAERRTRIELAIPFPNDYFGTRLVLLGEDEGVVALEIALFIHHLPALELFFQQKKPNPATGLSLELGVDGALLVSWSDRDTLQRHTGRIPLQPRGET